MSLKYVENDILKAKHGFIVHQINTKRTMDAGLANVIKRKYPRHYRECQIAPNQLGNVIVTPIKDRTWIVGLLSANENNQTHYKALKDCLLSLSLMIETLYPTEPVMFPYGMGCEVLSRDWPVIESFIEEHFENAYIVKK